MQIVQGTLTTVFSTTSESFTDTGLEVKITPSTAAKSILVRVCGTIAVAGATGAVHAQLLRDATPIAIGDAAGSRVQGSYGHNCLAAIGGEYHSNACGSGITIYDSPATASEVTYKLQIRRDTGGSCTAYLNACGTDADTADWGRPCATIIAWELD